MCCELTFRFFYRHYIKYLAFINPYSEYLIQLVNKPVCLLGIKMKLPELIHTNQGTAICVFSLLKFFFNNKH